MKVFLDVEPQLAASCQSAGRSVAGLEWVSKACDGDAVIIDKVSSVSAGKPILYLGALSELVDSSGELGELEGLISVGTGRRFEPSLQSLYQSHRAGQLGELGLLRMHRWFGGADPEFSLREDLLVHLDVALWLFGETPETIYAVSRESDSIMQIHLDLPKNGMAILDFAWALPAGRNYDSLHLIGDRGAAYSDDHRNVSLLYSGSDPRALRVENEEAGFAMLLSQFIGPVNESKPSLASLTDILAAKDVVDAVMRSSASGQPSSRIGNEFVEEEN
jgi:predicted dehydrogenase